MLLPLFEAIVNSIHAVEDANIPDGRIEIILERSRPIDLFRNEDEVDQESSRPPIDNFEIIDNGIGFDETNYASFKKAHSTHKEARGGKGIGRFLWLKAFSNVAVSSVFKQDDKLIERFFYFNNKGIDRAVLSDSKADKRRTTIKLIGYREQYRSKCPKKPETIANRIVEHCLIYFLNPRCPEIILKDGDSTININERFRQLTAGNKYVETFEAGGHEFKLTLLKWFEHDELTYHRLSLCANHREVETFNLTKVFPDVSGKIQDDETGKYYLLAGYIEGEYLDEHVDDERAQIEFKRGGLFDLELMSRDELYEGLEPAIKKRFGTVVDTFKERKLETLTSYINEVAPQYRILANYGAVLDDIVVTDGMTDQDIDLKLYKAYQDIDFESRKATASILKKMTEQEDSPDDLRSRYKEVLHRLSELNKSKLAQYVVHRKYIIELFEKSLAMNESGKYELEKTVHDIVFPTRTTSDDVDYNDQNLWLIDERLSFHTFLSSDKPLNTIEGLETESISRPDLAIFNNPLTFIEGEDIPFNSVVLVEFKRPMRKGYAGEDENPIVQVYDYIREIRSGKQIVKDGRPYPISDSTKFFCYLICDVNAKIAKYAEDAQLERTHDGLGFSGYNKALKCVIDIISFDQILASAKKRNKVLFHKLGI